MNEAGTKPSICWTFEGPGVPVTIVGDAAGAVIEELEFLLPGWSPVPARLGANRQGIFSIHQDAEGYHFVDQPVGATKTVPDAFSAAYHLTTRLFEAIANSCPLGLVLHAGATSTDTGAIAFAAPATTGKSMLGAAFALEGNRLLGDDRIIVSVRRSRAEAIPLGLAQKLRLPIPLSFTEKFAPLLERRSGRRIADSLFLKWDGAVQMPFGDTVPLTRLVLLARDGTSPPRWANPSRPDAIREILTLSATPGDSSRHLATARALVEQVPVAILRYESCFEARDAILSGETTVGD